LAVPLARAGESIGAIVLRRKEVRPFTDRQIELLKTFADQAVIAIENARLFEAEQRGRNELQARSAELAQSLDYQTATSAVLGVISRSPSDAQPVFDAIAASAMRLCNGARAVVSLFDGELLHLAAHTDTTVESSEAIRRYFPRRAELSGISGRVVREGRVIHIPKVQADPDYSPSLREALHVRSALGAPMLRNGRVIGAVTIGRTELHPFTEKEFTLLQTFAEQAVIAIENARLFEAEQASKRELQESLEYQTAMGEVLGVIARAPGDLQQVLDAVAESAARVCMAMEVRVFRLEGDKLRRAALVGRLRLSDDVGFSPDVPLSRGSVSGRAILDRRTIHVTDLAAEIESEYPEVAAHQKAIGHRTTLATPLLRDGKALGAIVVLRTEVAPFSDKQIKLLETFADQAVIAIENTRLFEAEQASKRELTEALGRGLN